MNAEKLAKLQSQVRIGGPGTVRRKKKIVHKYTVTDDKKLKSTIKKLNVNNIQGIEEVTIFKDDGTVVYFNKPEVQASFAANMFVINGQAENKAIEEVLPSFLNQLPADKLQDLKEKFEGLGTAGGEDDEVPELVENFDEASKAEAPSTLASKAEQPDKEISKAQDSLLEAEATLVVPEAETAPVEDLLKANTAQPEEKKE